MTAPPTTPETLTTTPMPRVRLADYGAVTLMLTALSIGLAFVTGLDQPPPAAERMLEPIFGLVGLTAVVWLLMVIYRNATIVLGITQARYYHDYNSHHPREWVERPARAFNNLFQVPVLFYLVCVLMLITRHVDAAQLWLAWIYVAIRIVHSAIYIGWNNVVWRFGSWVASCITLGVLWVRFIAAATPI
jgi:hypothetical protein